MKTHRMDALFGDMYWKEGRWVTTTQWTDHSIQVTVAPHRMNWEAIHSHWTTLCQRFQSIKNDEVAEVLHYDCSIEWGNHFRITEEQLFAFIHLDGVHFSPRGCQLVFRVDDFLREDWIAQAMHVPTKIVVDLDGQIEIEKLDYVDMNEDPLSA